MMAQGLGRTSTSMAQDMQVSDHLEGMPSRPLLGMAAQATFTSSSFILSPSSLSLAQARSIGSTSLFSRLSSSSLAQAQPCSAAFASFRFSVNILTTSLSSITSRPFRRSGEARGRFKGVVSRQRQSRRSRLLQRRPSRQSKARGRFKGEESRQLQRRQSCQLGSQQSNASWAGRLTPTVGPCVGARRIRGGMPYADHPSLRRRTGSETLHHGRIATIAPTAGA